MAKDHLMPPIVSPAARAAFHVIDHEVSAELRSKAAAFDGNSKRFDESDIEALLAAATPERRSSVAKATEIYTAKNDAFSAAMNVVVEEARAAGQARERLVRWTGVSVAVAAGIACGFTFGTPVGWCLLGVAALAFIVGCCGYLFGNAKRDDMTHEVAQRLDVAGLAAQTEKARLELRRSVVDVLTQTPAPPTPAPDKPSLLRGVFFGRR